MSITRKEGSISYRNMQHLCVSSYFLPPAGIKTVEPVVLGALNKPLQEVENSNSFLNSIHRCLLDHLLRMLLQGLECSFVKHEAELPATTTGCCEPEPTDEARMELGNEA